MRAKEPKRLPVVLTPEEVQAVPALLNGEIWLICSLLHSAGLRLFECLSSRVKETTIQKAVREAGIGLSRRRYPEAAIG